MGGIVGGSRNREIKQAQNNLHYIVSYYFAQEKIPTRTKNPFVICQQVQEDKKIKNYPLASFKFDKNNLKYTKYEYRQFKIIQMIMLSPGCFVSLTEEGLQIWYENNGIQKITAQFFDKIKNNSNSDISNCEIKKFDSDLFYLTFLVKQRQNNSNININLNNIYNKINDLQGPQFVLFSMNKIIKEGKIIELFSINRIEFAYPISPSHVFALNKEEIKLLDFRDKKLFKIDKNLDILKYPIKYSCFLIEDLVLISSKIKKYSVIYSANKLNTIYEINEFIEIAFNLGNNKVILIGEKIKEIIFFPEMHIFSLEQYETDIFASLETKTFYPINNSTFYYINHKNRKLKEVFLNEFNQLIIKKEIICPIDTIKFCPFTYSPPISGNSEEKEDAFFLCALFICKEQTYFLRDENLSELFISENEPSFYSSTKRLFLSFFENKYIDIINPIEGIIEANNKKIVKKEMKGLHLSFIVFSNVGESTLNFASMKNKNLIELDCHFNIIEKEIKSEIITKDYNKEIYIISIIQNSLIYIVKINDITIRAKKENFNFGNNIRNIGVLNLDNYLAFIYLDKKAIIINIEDSFENKINPIDTFLFPFDIIYSYNCGKEIVLVTKNRMYIFDYHSKKIEKEMTVDSDISSKDEINISQIENEIYIFRNGYNYFLFDINKFEIIIDISEYSLKNKSFLIYNRLPNKFEIIKKDIFSDRNIQIFREEIYENKIKMKYLSNGRIFVGCYPNKFFIFENN